VGIYEQIETAFQDMVAPELNTLRGDIRLLDQKITGVEQKLVRTAIDARERLAALEVHRSH
jgi:hypothetical protein